MLRCTAEEDDCGLRAVVRDLLLNALDATWHGGALSVESLVLVASGS